MHHGGVKGYIVDERNVSGDDAYRGGRRGVRGSGKRWRMHERKNGKSEVDARHRGRKK
jgi:hypothetical protein